MSQKDLQFIERALAHPWMFWVYFWKWPRIVRQACAEYDMLAKERDAAKAAHERSERANKIVRDWIHVTHRLSTTPEAIRAIFAAGKRLSILLVFFVVTNTYGQAPPYLRNQWTTNANPLALKVISTNGVHAATNVWELDFTNTATVTVSAVSNTNKVMVSAAVTGELTNWANLPTNAFSPASSAGGTNWTRAGGVLTPSVTTDSVNVPTGQLFWGDADTRKWSLTHIGTDFGGGFIDYIGIIGINIAANGTRADTTKAAVSMNMEVDYLELGVTNAEWHVNLTTPTGGGARPFFSVLDYATTNVGNTIRGTTSFTTEPGVALFTVNRNGELRLETGSAFYKNNNAQNFLLQRNAAGTQLLNCGFLTSLNEWALDVPIAPMGIRNWFPSYLGNTYLINNAFLYASNAANTVAIPIIGANTSDQISLSSGGRQILLGGPIYGPVLTNNGNSGVLTLAGYTTATAAGSYPAAYISEQFGPTSAPAGNPYGVTIILDLNGSFKPTQAIGSQVAVNGRDGGTTALGISYNSSSASLAGRFTDYRHYAAASVFKSSGTVGTEVGFYAADMTAGDVDNFAFYAAGTTKSYFGGNVGIKTNAPSEALHVHGNALVRSNLKVDGSITNDALTASTVLAADATKEIVSIANGAGVLTNNGSGVVGWKPLSDFGGAQTPWASDINAATFSLTNLGSLFANDTGRIGFTTDSFLIRDATHTLAMKNGNNAQGFYLYNKFTDASNYERAGLAWIGDQCWMLLQNAGTGIYRDFNFTGASISFYTGANSATATRRWTINANGHLVAGADNTYDIGASGATRPKNTFVANVSTSASFASAATNRVAISASGYTNTLTVGSIAVDVDVYFDAATAALQDSAGNVLHTFQAGTNITAHLKPNWRLVGTTMAGNAIAH